MKIVEYWNNKPDENGQLPPCQVYVSIDRPECNEPAKRAITIKTAVSTVTADMCEEHIKEHERKVEAYKRRRAAERRIKASDKNSN